MRKELLVGVSSFLDSWLLLRYERNEIPGFVVSIAWQEAVVFNKAYGYANLEAKQKLTTEHIFRVASHSKTFTATAIMQLAENKQLSINDYLISHLPWLKEHKDSRMKKVTIRQLLSHGAGVVRDGIDADFWQLRNPFPNKNVFKESVLQTDLFFDTNVQMKYSNLGYTLLGMVVEAISGMPYNEYVQKHIIQLI